jgi:hypothetical protein
MKKLRNMNLAIIFLLELMILLTGAKLQNKIESGKVFLLKNTLNDLESPCYLLVYSL